MPSGRVRARGIGRRSTSRRSLGEALADLLGGREHDVVHLVVLLRRRLLGPRAVVVPGVARLDERRAHREIRPVPVRSDEQQKLEPDIHARSSDHVRSLCVLLAPPVHPAVKIVARARVVGRVREPRAASDQLSRPLLKSRGVRRLHVDRTLRGGRGARARGHIRLHDLGVVREQHARHVQQEERPPGRLWGGEGA